MAESVALQLESYREKAKLDWKVDAFQRAIAPTIPHSQHSRRPAMCCCVACAVVGALLLLSLLLPLLLNPELLALVTGLSILLFLVLVTVMALICVAVLFPGWRKEAEDRVRMLIPSAPPATEDDLRHMGVDKTT
ncbi:unnamed protein product [Vitrella brassicaformis CCMP3155]|uniref:Uncharacterized protein n=2 Tax=Vitrella brassicaformis TaxID=1169539 RepID=A0A0G4E971_VITBC|nr:unnamed protein product [Vitrella brassicaformis CCMP3155]|mmetsp:Transcript_40111/g.100398  ORF Transcript_40111/g.100398 Transcript_40111/m.100398 type:complete len:135 (+) Transcript_40111:80-484(+)|eukprot:CEL92115.1 unnamed protein product [Vitrella brassicaformis CCMP3155]